jgi:hypothetical protein
MGASGHRYGNVGSGVGRKSAVDATARAGVAGPRLTLVP